MTRIRRIYADNNLKIRDYPPNPCHPRSIGSFHHRKRMQEEENNMELRSEEFQEVLGDTPPWILRGGITLLAIVVLVLLAGSAVFKYPDILAHHYLNRFSLKQSLYHR